MQIPENARSGLLPAVVRLKALDDCLGRDRDVLDLGPTATRRRHSLSVELPPELGTAVDDGEFRPLDDLCRETPPGVREDELECQMVESGSIVVDALADANSPLWWWPAEIGDPEARPPLSLSIQSDFAVVWLSQEFTDLLGKSVEVVLCPVELEVDPL
jgi:hypothetical protein